MERMYGTTITCSTFAHEVSGLGLANNKLVIEASQHEKIHSSPEVEQTENL